MKQKRLLAILGSPHPQGTSATMLSLLTNAARKSGWHVDVISLYDLNIAYCIGCRTCLNTKQCILKDDLQSLIPLLQECDVVALASPIYWANVPAIVKNLFDRMLGVAMEETKTFPKGLLHGKQYILLSACHTANPFAWMFGQTRYAIRSMKEFFKTAGMKHKATIICTNTKQHKIVSHKLQKKIESIFA